MIPQQDPFLPYSSRNLIWTGAVFLALGLAAIAVPAWATLAVEQLVAVLLLVWGAAGIGFGLSMRPLSDWRMTVALYTAVLALGALFLIFPRDGVATMSILLVAVFLFDGVASIAIGFGLREALPNWQALVLSGATSLALGLFALSGWPGTAALTLGLLTGLNFLSSGIALILMGRAIYRSRRS